MTATKEGGEETDASHQEGDERKTGGSKKTEAGEKETATSHQEKPVSHLEEMEASKSTGRNPGGPQSDNPRDSSPNSWARETEQLADQERKKSTLIRNTVNHLHNKLVTSGGVLSTDDAAFFTSSIATLDSSRFELIDGAAMPMRGLDPFMDLRVMLKQFMNENQPRLTHCESLYERLAEDITRNVTNILKSRKGPRVPRTLSQSRRRSSSVDADESNKRSRQQLCNPQFVL